MTLAEAVALDRARALYIAARRECPHTTEPNPKGDCPAHPCCLTKAMALRYYLNEKARHQ